MGGGGVAACVTFYSSLSLYFPWQQAAAESGAHADESASQADEVPPKLPQLVSEKVENIREKQFTHVAEYFSCQ